ncbi:Protein YOP1 [Spathaspora sp. JA1]|nr:Protein YOP1 [Spathaspora sp. JA1]
MSVLPEQLKNVHASFTDVFPKATSGLPLLHHFEEQSGLPRSYFVIPFSLIYFVMIFVNAGGLGQLLSNIVGLVIPGYYSLLALQTKSTKDDTQLLTYWVVFAFLNVIEFWSSAILYWMPFYFLFKAIFLVWTGVPNFGGANIVYINVIKPVADSYFSSHKDSVAKKIDEAAEAVSSSVHL